MLVSRVPTGYPTLPFDPTNPIWLLWSWMMGLKSFMKTHPFGCYWYVSHSFRQIKSIWFTIFHELTVVILGGMNNSTQPSLTCCREVVWQWLTYIIYIEFQKSSFYIKHFVKFVNHLTFLNQWYPHSIGWKMPFQARSALWQRPHDCVPPTSCTPVTRNEATFGEGRASYASKQKDSWFEIYPPWN